MLRKKILLTITLLLIFALAVPVFAQSEDGKGEKDAVNPFCLAGAEMQHPVGKRIAATYELEYAQVMQWFCEDNYGFGQILLALRTSKTTELTPEQALELKTSMGGWGKVWKEYGRPGRPDHAGPPAWKGEKAGKMKGADDIDDSDDLEDTDKSEARKGPPPWAGKKDKNRP
jgi:hypothetical protein